MRATLVTTLDTKYHPAQDGILKSFVRIIETVVTSIALIVH